MKTKVLKNKYENILKTSGFKEKRENVEKKKLFKNRSKKKKAQNSVKALKPEFLLFYISKDRQNS